MKEYYKVLGLKNNATNEDIKRAYLHLSSKIHPDKGGNDYLFGKVKEAYEILSNKKEKKQSKYQLFQLAYEIIKQQK